MVKWGKGQLGRRLNMYELIKLEQFCTFSQKVLYLIYIVCPTVDLPISDKARLRAIRTIACNKLKAHIRLKIASLTYRKMQERPLRNINPSDLQGTAINSPH